MAKGGVIHSVRCRVYSLIENKDKFVGCKWDKLINQAGHKIIIHDLL